jgi:hypothetical protein
MYRIREMLRMAFAPWAGPAPRRHAPLRTLLTLETLESRVVPTTNNYWIGPAYGLWSNPANWSAGHTPSSQDWITFNASPGKNTNSVDDLKSVTVQNWVSDPSYTATITLLTGNRVTSTTNVSQYGTLALGPGSTLDSFNYFYANGATTMIGPHMASAAASIIAPHTLLNGSLLVTGFSSGGGPALTITGVVSQAGTLTLGTAGGGAGSLSISGAGYNVDTGGLTTLNLGSTLSYSGSTQILDSGTILMLGATLRTASGVSLTGGALDSEARGDAIAGDVTNSGVLNVTGSPHTLTITGNYTQTGAGTLDLRIDSTGGNYLLSVGGVATLGGTLDVTASGGIAPINESWYLIKTGGGIVRNFATIALPPPSAGFSWSESTASGIFILTLSH